MPVNILEELAAEWLEYKGYFVRRNENVGKGDKGGYECELDVVAFHPKTKHLVHIEPTTKATSGEKLEKSYKKKLEAGRKYIHKIFSGLVEPDAALEQIVLVGTVAGIGKQELAGGKVVHIPAFLREITDHLKKLPMKKKKVPEKFPLLVTLHYVVEFQKSLFGATIQP